MTSPVLRYAHGHVPWTGLTQSRATYQYQPATGLSASKCLVRQHSNAQKPLKFEQDSCLLCLNPPEVRSYSGNQAIELIMAIVGLGLQLQLYKDRRTTAQAQSTVG